MTLIVISFSWLSKNATRLNVWHMTIFYFNHISLDLAGLNHQFKKGYCLFDQKENSSTKGGKILKNNIISKENWPYSKWATNKKAIVVCAIYAAKCIAWIPDFSGCHHIREWICSEFMVESTSMYTHLETGNSQK